MQRSRVGLGILGLLIQFIIPPIGYNYVIAGIRLVEDKAIAMEIAWLYSVITRMQIAIDKAILGTAYIDNTYTL